MSYDEEEQIERLKQFWKEYGTAILIGIALAMAVFAGWRYWQKSQVETATQAANLYQDVLADAQKLQANPQDQAANTDLQSKAKKLQDEFAKTPHAMNAGLLLAKRAVEANDLKEAEKQLRWVLEQKPEEGLRIVTAIRLARVLAASGKLDDGLALLAKEKNDAFTPALEETRGDIYRLQGKLEEARKAYQAADAALAARDEVRPLLEVKMADVGLAPVERKPREDGF